jgi:hypothetical protein
VAAAGPDPLWSAMVGMESPSQHTFEFVLAPHYGYTIALLGSHGMWCASTESNCAQPSACSHADADTICSSRRSIKVGSRLQGHKRPGIESWDQ